VTNWYEVPLPSFKNPPVIESALAVEFPAVTGLNPAALNRLQKVWEDRYPDLEDRPGTPPTPLHSSGEVLFNFVPQDGGGLRRIWATGRGDGRLVQTQNDRLILNWRKEASKGPYPGFNTLLPEFEKIWNEMGEFMEAAGYLPRSPALAEYTYVNAVPIAPGDSFGDVVLLLTTPGDTVPGVESFTRFQFIRDIHIKDKHPFEGQVFVQGEPQQYANKRQLVFTVTARLLVGGRPEGPIEGLKAAHRLATLTFEAVVPEEKRKAWGQQ
jgi:uncharacterized protein (TIGR04255 family)